MLLLAGAQASAQEGVSYSVPLDNPFVATPGARPEVCSLGLRNPYRFSFDRTYRLPDDRGRRRRLRARRSTGCRAGGARGANFGWPCTEGRSPDRRTGPAPPKNTLAPIFDYPHDDRVFAVTGGYVVRDPALPDLAGRYLWGDFYDGQLRTLRYSYSNPGDTLRGVDINQLSSFGEDALGHLYAADFDGGQVYRLLPGATTGSLSTQVVGTFANPIFITAPPGDTSRLFVVERSGTISLVKDGATLPTPFLDITDLVLPDGEQGLLSMAFAPDYATSKLFYVFYTDRAGNNRIEEFRRYTSDRASRASRRVVLRIEHPIGDEPQRRPAAVRPRRLPLRLHRRPRRRRGPSHHRPESRLIARQAAADRPRATGGLGRNAPSRATA